MEHIEKVRMTNSQIREEISRMYDDFTGNGDIENFTKYVAVSPEGEVMQTDQKLISKFFSGMGKSKHIIDDKEKIVGVVNVEGVEFWEGDSQEGIKRDIANFLILAAMNPIEGKGDMAVRYLDHMLGKVKYKEPLFPNLLIPQEETGILNYGGEPFEKGILTHCGIIQTMGFVDRDHIDAEITERIGSDFEDMIAYLEKKNKVA